jgi:hypothetical protein
MLRLVAVTIGVLVLLAALAALSRAHRVRRIHLHRRRLYRLCLFVAGSGKLRHSLLLGAPAARRVGPRRERADVVDGADEHQRHRCAPDGYADSDKRWLQGNGHCSRQYPEGPRAARRESTWLSSGPTLTRRFPRSRLRRLPSNRGSSPYVQLLSRCGGRGECALAQRRLRRDPLPPHPPDPFAETGLAANKCGRRSGRQRLFCGGDRKCRRAGACLPGGAPPISWAGGWGARHRCTASKQRGPALSHRALAFRLAGV